MSQSTPRGIEVLVKKAAVDPAFKTLLLDDRAAAAAEIGLELSPSESFMLAAIPRAQLETIIAQTSVPEEHRRAFQGKAAAAMLAALSIVTAAPGCGTGSRPDRPDKDKGKTTGSRPDRPSGVEPPKTGESQP
jgi:hypothetical protein